MAPILAQTLINRNESNLFTKGNSQLSELILYRLLDLSSDLNFGYNDLKITKVLFYILLFPLTNIVIVRLIQAVTFFR